MQKEQKIMNNAPIDLSEYDDAITRTVQQYINAIRVLGEHSNQQTPLFSLPSWY